MICGSTCLGLPSASSGCPHFNDKYISNIYIIISIKILLLLLCSSWIDYEYSLGEITHSLTSPDQFAIAQKCNLA